nr:SH3 domain-containing protein [Lachnospiraceae bacterium]
EQETGQGAEGEGGTQEEGSGQEQEPEEENEASAVGTISIVSNVNVRDNPSTEGTNVIKVAKAGETYEYFGITEDDNWYIIHVEDGSLGYIYKKYVSVN